MNQPANGQIQPAQGAPAGGASEARKRRQARRTILALLAVCIAPVIASYVAYYWFPPSGRTNYGDLISPPRDLAAVAIDPEVIAPATAGQRVLPISRDAAAQLGNFAGRWAMVVVAPLPCDSGCRERLYKMRQVRLTTGKHRNRVERLWLLPVDPKRAQSGQRPPDELLKEHAGMWVARISHDDLARHFPAPGSIAGHIYLIDPLSKLMMRFPSDADPSRMKKDLNKLLKASRIG